MHFFFPLKGGGLEKRGEGEKLNLLVAGFIPTHCPCFEQKSSLTADGQICRPNTALEGLAS